MSDGVTYVEYLESSGTQYIDTGFIGNQDTRVVVDFELFGGANKVLYGARVSSSSDGINFFKRSAGYFCSQYNDTLLNTTAAHDTNRHTVDANKNVTYLDGVAEATFTAGTFTVPGSLYLFALNDNGEVDNYCSAKIYSCQIYDNGVLVRDYWPCYDPEGVACLYDKVTKTYYYNAGTGSFTAPSTGGDSGVAVGTTWAYTSNGTFEVPADGSYQIEMHGGGGGACVRTTYDSSWNAYYALASGGGSGEMYTLALTKGEHYAITIGSGGASISGGPSVDAAEAGGSTSFGSYTVNGGGGGDGRGSVGGAAHGSLATSGAFISGGGTVAGGYGNKNNTAQTYGNGGSVTASSPQNGQPGAVIITYLGG